MSARGRAVMVLLGLLIAALMLGAAHHEAVRCDGLHGAEWVRECGTP